MKKIVLTGPPCSGKTTVLQALLEEFGNDIIIVPEAATMLLASGFPVPGKDVPWTESWQKYFQRAVVRLQESLEDAYELVAENKGIKVMICDRGILDGAAYLPGGINELERLNGGGDLHSSVLKYNTVIHLESLATIDPEKYGKRGNDCRFEPLSRAIELEKAIKEVWAHHPHRLVIDGRRGIEGKISETVGIVKFLLNEKPEEEK